MIAWVGAFYVMDEPFLDGVTFDELSFAVARIKETFPGIPVMTTFAAPTVFSPTLRVPENLDWLGFDRYGDFNAIPLLLEQLKSRLAPHQRVFLVPDGILERDTDAQVASWNYEYLSLAESDPVVIGMLVFHWSEARKLPLTFAAQRDIGARIVQHMKCTVSLLCDPLEGGRVSGTGLYVAGMQPRVSATANPYYAFSGWVGGPVANPAAASTTITNLFTNVVMRAVFTPSDTDQDGLPDGWMMQTFGHTNGIAVDNSRPQDDADGDGATNLHEYLAGTNPRDASSVLKLVVVQRLVDPLQVMFCFNAMSNKAYNLLCQDRLVVGGWNVHATYDARPTNWVVWVTNTVSLTTNRFYCVQRPRGE